MSSLLSSSYSAKQAEKDSQRILSDPYIFDIWHDVKKFSESVLDLPEIDSALGLSLEKMRFVDFVENSLCTHHSILCNLCDPKNLVRCQKRNNDDDKQPLPLLPLEPQKRIEFLSSLPLKIPLSIVPEIEKITLKQIKKDFERDRVIINSNRVIGAALTLDGIILAIEDVLDRNLLHCSMPLLSSNIKREFSFQILKMASRTNSSGIAFEELNKLLDPQDCLLLPFSDVIRSIGIHISLESMPFSNNTVAKSGFHVKIQVSSFYRILSPNPELLDVPTDHHEIIEIIYQNYLFLDIDESQKDEKIIERLRSSTGLSDGLRGEILFKLFDQE